MGLVSRIFVFAGLVNIVGTLGVSAGFTNRYLTELDPVVFSWLGLVSIILWGAAYIAVSKRYQQVPALVAVFAIEKFVYFAAWLMWLREPPAPLTEIFSRSATTGAFFASYGLIDLSFGIFFAWAYFRTKSGRS